MINKHFYVNYEPYNLGYGVYIVGKNQYDPADTYKAELKLVKLDKTERAAYQPPAMDLQEVEIQNLMEALWAAGIRPKAVQQEINLKNLENHIEDLRKIAFHTLDIQKNSS